MAPQRPEDGFVRMPEHEFEAILARAAEEGVKLALADVGATAHTLLCLTCRRDIRIFMVGSRRREPQPWTPRPQSATK